MQIILLERVEKLGNLGDEVSVKSGYGRNYLIPQGKALRANAANRARFEAEREAIEQRNAEAAAKAADAGKNLDGAVLTLIRQSGDTGNLYGSVSARDIVEAAGENDHKLRRSQIKLNAPIKTIGMFDVDVQLHAEVVVTVKVNVARTPDEAERQAAGENIIETLEAENSAVESERAAAAAEAAADRAEAFGGMDDED